jgi:hypothetical protein
LEHLIEDTLPTVLTSEPLIVAVTFLGAIALGLVWLLSVAIRHIAGRKR